MALSLPAYAADVQDADSAVTTKDVVVTATRTEAEVKTVPQTVEVITAEDIEKLGLPTFIRLCAWPITSRS